MEKENEKINKCSICGNEPKTADVGGNIPCIEICCVNCNIAEYGRTRAEAIKNWNNKN
jgi:hypothetical protein